MRIFNKPDFQMENEKKNNKMSLSRRIFLYFLGISFLSVILVGFFWIDSKRNDYHKEIEILKKTFSETKKFEIKNKILQIKDYILWFQNAPLKPLSQTISYEITHLNLPLNKTSEIPNHFSNQLPQAFVDSILHAHVPIYIINRYGKTIFSYNPFGQMDNKMLYGEKELLHQVLTSEVNKGVLSLYKNVNSNDSILEGIACFDNQILPGFKVVSIVSSSYFEKVLQQFVLDTISRLRYAENEYIFVNSFSGKALVTNGKYNKNPIDIISSGSKVWISIFKVQQSASQFPEGVFHTYKWKKLSTSDSSLKTSYFSYMPQWKWIIGTGFYEDDVNAIIELKKKALYADMQKSIFEISVYLLISWLLCYFLISLFSRRLKINIDLFKSFFEKAAHGNLLIDKSLVSYQEFASIAEGTNRMVEERKLAGKALKESEAQYRYLFEQNPVPMFIYELFSLKMLLVNEAFIKHYGYSMDEALSLRLSDLYPEDERKGITDLTTQLKGLAYAGEWHHLKKDGSQITIEANSHGFSFEDRVARIVVITDITKRKQLELFLIEAKEKAEEGDQLKTAFLHNISHEIRTPMNAIIGFSSFLSEPDLELDKRSNFIEIINQNCNQLLDIITDIVNVATLEAGKDKINISEVNVNTILKTLCAQFEYSANLKKINLNCKTDLDDKEAVIQTDHTKFIEIISNLINNAIKFTKVGSVSFGYYLRDNYLEFYVKDTGIGIPTDMQKVIFERFRQVESKDSGEFGGTGLGLAISKGYVTLLGGKIWVLSQPGNGSTFYFDLPYTQKIKVPKVEAFN